MRIEQRIVDLNAYIENINYEIKDDQNGKKLVYSFTNVSSEIITAIKLKCTCYDSFDDKIKFDDVDYLEVKKATLNIKPTENASFVVNIKQCDLQKTKVELLQIVYSNGEKVDPIDEDIVKYDINVLSSSRSVDDHIESDMFSYMKEKNDKAICFPKEHSAGWICSCGRLNKNSQDQCVGCGYSKNSNFKDFNEENIEHNLNERIIQKKAEEEKKEAELRTKEEREIKRTKLITISVISAVVLVVVIGILSTIIHNATYGLSEKEEAQYSIADKNYREIKMFILRLSNEYSSIAEKYSDIDSYKDYLSVAEKNADYLHSRGIYLLSSLLYDTIKEHYPEKYHKAYDQLVSLQKGKIYNDYLITETRHVKNQNSSEMRDMAKGLEEAIETMEDYMKDKTLNPSKVELANAEMPQPEYSKVYGINLGVLFYDDGSLHYIGEVKDGKANGYGTAWYPSDKDNGTCCIGQFVDGIFNSGDSFGVDGNSISVSELKDVSFEGEFEMVQGPSTSSISSEEAAKQAKDDEEIDKLKARDAVEAYLDILREKQSSIKKVTWVKVPEVSGDNYYFSCTVEYSGFVRKGTITVEKDSYGTFKATGLDFDD